MPKAPVDGSLPWKLVWWFAFFLRPILCKLNIDGVENVPLTGGIVLASNHRSSMDIIVKGYSCPRQIHYMAKIELFQINALVTWFFTTFGVFPVDRGGRDLNALGEAVRLVRSGKAICIYPEGTRNRSGSLKSGKSGAARIAMAADAPVVPVITLNSERLFRDIIRWGRPTITVRFGKPICLHGDPNKSADARRETQKIMRAIAALLPPEMRGAFSK